ncbi:MAG: hypothetical protein HYW49_10315 [Deltaproteobacteria bacterium]|nr:hypothetical protein [Deltaproteobacteria bacterium]
MDITQDLKKKREKSERGSAKRSRGSTAPETVELNGKIYELPPDYNELEEINYDDPGVQKWLAEIEAESIRRYGKTTHEELDYMYQRRQELQKIYPSQSVVELNQMALAEFRSARK